MHNVYVCRNTALERAYRAGEYVPLTEDAYVELAVDALTELRPDIIIHRVVADPAPGELVAPDWATRKGDLVRFIQHAYHRRCGGAEKLGGRKPLEKFLPPQTPPPPLQRLSRLSNPCSQRSLKPP
ncbi:MAG: hypothetical protein ACLUDQ_02060 [Bilophila wadsworthia]